MDNKLEADYGTLKFSFDGQPYEIDLSTTSFERFKKAVAPFIKNATEVEEEAPRRWVHQRSDGDAIRAWAAKSGIHQVAPRGRIKQSVVDAYDLWKSTQDSEKATAKA